MVEREEESEVPDEERGVWGGEEITENEQMWYSAESGGEKKKEHQDEADWVKVAIGGIDEGDWTEPRDVGTVVKNAGRFLLEAIQKT